MGQRGQFKTPRSETALASVDSMLGGLLSIVNARESRVGRVNVGGQNVS